MEDTLEKREIIQKLKKHLKNMGYGDLINILLENEEKVYTKKGRLNKSGACRASGWKTKQLEDALAACRIILKNDYFRN
jgi:hypothetical protein